MKALSHPKLFIGAGRDWVDSGLPDFRGQKGFGGLIPLSSWVFGSKKWQTRGGSMIIPPGMGFLWSSLAKIQRNDTPRGFSILKNGRIQ